MAVWFSGDGERNGNKVKIKGSTARIPQTGALTWQPAFDVGYNGTGTPDTNPALITELAQGGVVCASVTTIWETINFKDWAGVELRYRDATVSTDSNGNPSFD
ncbi:Uncharacterised protein [BD1-7 clade bacterium]|uniref:Uncharacterized protein n=1 Tax=BD1-7 clade bacterium TaxID=2029982 RepID=A0A5S9QFI4_9GAMM|nr:Uncharacterised protein [BD1-7 clade bacterium]CAA0109914.1 Uncharacterised protein [BD1-7 clade bacterium]CAA0116641.1 Uncharacterised protein [BD1-7 clade bacterium]